MNTSTIDYPSSLRNAPAAARNTLRLLERLQHGQLTRSTARRHGAACSDRHPPTALRPRDSATPHAMVALHNWNVCAATLKSGDIGFAESYIAGDWSTPNLTELLKLFIRNRQQLEDVIYGSWAGRALYRLKHWLNRNTRSNSQKNIHAHYDLGNAFYQLWLDDTMNYSSAWFEGDHGKSMREAQNAKVRRALRMADVQPGDRVLEIGCGWGALAEMAVTEFGASVTGVTLSTEQLAFARQRMDELGAAPGDRADGRPAAAGLPRHPGRPLRRDLLDRDGRGGRPGLLADLFPERAPPAQARRPGLYPEHRHRRQPVRPLHPLERLHPAIHLPGRLPAVPARVPPRGRSSRPAGGRRTGIRPGLCRDPAPLAPGLPAPARGGRCGSASTSASCASGSSTSATARRRSTWATSTWCSTRWSRPTR